MRKLYALAALFFFTSQAFGQVDVVANSTTTTYANLKLAFDAVNAGTHTGAITINITGSGTYTNPAAPAVLNSTATGSANYSSVLIQPTADAVTVNATTVGGRGVIELNGADNVTINGDNPNTAGTNRNLTIQHTAAATTTYTSVIRVMSTNVAEYNTNANITITNLILLGNVTSGNSSSITSTTGSSNASFGVIVGPNGGASPSTITGVATGMSTTSPAPTVNNFVVSNCSINQVARGISFLGGATTSSSLVTLSNNTIGSGTTSTTFPSTTPSSIYTKGISIQGVDSANISSNTITNVGSYVGTAIAGIEAVSSVRSVNVTSNQINGVFQNVVSGSSSARGVSIASSSGVYSVSGNTVSNVQNSTSSTTITNRPNAIYISTSATAGVIDKNLVSTVYNRNSATYGVTAVHLNGGNNITVSNNIIYDVNEDATGGAAFSLQYGINGLLIGSGIGHKIYHNTIALSGTVLGTPSSSLLTFAFGVSATSLTGIDVRNNIFSNTMTGGTTSIAHVPVYLPSGGTSSMNLTLNNNAFLTGSTSGVHGMYHAGTTYTNPVTSAGVGLYSTANFVATTTSGTTNARNYTNSLSSGGTNDNSSFILSASPFVSASDYHINLGTTPTRLESGGASVGVTIDYDNQARPGPAGSVNGGANGADIGADEFDGVPLDQTSPTILYSTVAGTASTANRVLAGFATITDNSGINSNVGAAPRLYFKKSGDANDANGWKFVEASNNASPFSFTIDYSLLTAGSVSPGDVIQYTIVAQDNATTPNVGINSGSFAATPTSVALTSAAFPIGGTLNSYIIQSPISGTKTVCPSGCDYTTLTASGGAFDAINSNGLGSATSLQISGNLTETGAIALNEWTEYNGSNYTLSIYPTGSARTITGTLASGALIRLNGADRVTIDGSIGGTGTDKSLTISNTNTTAPGGIALISLGAGVGANNNTIQNCNVSGTTAAPSSSVGIQLGGSSLSSTGADNDGNTIKNNSISGFATGIFAFGTAATSVGGIENVLIQGNTITVASGTTTATVVGIQTGASLSANILDNAISIETSGAGSPVGISIQLDASGTLVTRNTISKVLTTATNGYGGRGITVATGLAASNVTISNNVIAGVNGSNFSSFGNSSALGIGIGVLGTSTTLSNATGGVNVYHNSVNMAGSYAYATACITTALYIGSGVSGNIDVRNNVFGNSLNNTDASGTASKNYAVYTAAANTVFSNIEGNNYFVSGTQGVLGFLTSDRSTLAALRTGFGGNLTSVNTNPNFTSATNLLPTSGQLATNITGVTTDILNTTRRTPTSMGAYAVNTAGVWSATAASTDYATSSNWRDNLPPTATTAVYIPAASTNWPNIGANTTIYQLQNLGTLTSDAAATLTITDNVTNTGTINANGGVTLGGTTAQTIATGTASSNFNVANLTLNNSTGATLSGSGFVNLTGAYTGTSGTLTAGGRLVFKSTATVTARHASGTISGNVVVERFVPAKPGGRKSIFLASPVTANLNSAGWQQQIHITGVVGTCTGGITVPANAFDATLLGNPSMFNYNDANASGAKWVAISTTNQNLVPGTGYRVLVRGPRSQGCTLLTTTPAQDEVTLSATGVLAQGNQTLPLISAGLFQLTGNPYASSIDFDAVKTAAGANIEASYWTYNPANAAGVYSVYNDGSITNTLTNAPGGYLNHGIIASGQAFFIKRTSGNLGNLSAFYQDAHKVATAQSGLFRTSNTRSWQKLARVAVQAAGDSSHLEDAVIRFGTTGIQKHVLGNSDAEHLSNAATQLASRKAGQWQAIQTRPVLTSGDDTVALRLTSPGAANLQLSLTELVDMTGIQVILRDKQLGTQTPLALNQPVAIQVTGNPASQGPDRFELIFRSSATLASKFTSIKASRSAALARNEVRFTAQEDGGTNQYQLEASANGGQSFEPVSGATTPGSKQAGTFSYQLNDERAITATQTVHYRIKATGNQTSYSQVVKVDAKGGAELTVKAYPNPVTDVLNIQLTGAIGQVDIRLLDAQGRVVLSQRQTVNGQQTISLATKELAAGKYLLQATGKGGETLATQSIVKE